METVHSLWIGKQLSSLELLTIYSFLSHGYTFTLWCYDNITNLPDTVICRNANEIIASNSIFYYKKTNKYGHGKGSVSGFSDLFRYKLLYEYGGIWVDMDVTCLKRININDDYIFRHHHQLGLVGNFLKVPKHSALMLWCYEQTSMQVDEHNTNWLLPIEILNKGVAQFRLTQYIQSISNIDSFLVVRKLILTNTISTHQWSIIHWMNEEFRRLNLNKNIAIEGSTYAKLLAQYSIPHTIASSKTTREIRWKTSKLHYSWLNLIARMNWLLNYFFK